MTAARPVTLDDWLRYLETLHPKTIALGLERVRQVLDRLDVRLGVPVITVTGTNGKGSTCAMLDAIARAAGYRTALYTSPHLLRYNERVRIDGVEATDSALVDAFEVVEAARKAGDEAVPLTYFEFGTLAALVLFARADPDLVILEVGLGGRLDAVNVIDADVAVITSIGVDHVDYLGPDRESIAREKIGIARRGRPLVCGDANPPARLKEDAAGIGATLLAIGRDFGCVDEARQWRYWGTSGERFGLPVPALRGAFQLANAATAITALAALGARLPVHAGAIRDGLTQVELPGRFQVLPGRPLIVLDVAHNPEAAATLAATLGTMGFHPVTHAVVGMLADKDIEGVLAAVRSRVDRWYVCSLPGPRGAMAAALGARLLGMGVPPQQVQTFESVDAALQQAREKAEENDRIVVFGSFLTVGAALVQLSRGLAPEHA